MQLQTYDFTGYCYLAASVMLVAYAVTAVFILNCDFRAIGNELFPALPPLSHRGAMVTNYSGITASIWNGLEDKALKSPTTDLFVSDQASISDNVTASSMSTVWTIKRYYSETTASSAVETSSSLANSPPSTRNSSFEKTSLPDTSQTTWADFIDVPSTTLDSNILSSVNSNAVDSQMTSPATTGVAFWTTLSTTLLINDSLESSTASNGITSESLFTDNLTYPTTSVATSSNSTTGTTRFQQTSEMSTIITTPGTTPTTTPPICTCQSMELVLGPTQVGSSWFAVSFNSTTSSTLCVHRNLTGLNVTLYGPFEKEEFPAELQTCSPSIDCLYGTDHSFLFNSTLCCKEDIVVRQCSNYTFTMIPQYSSCIGHPVNTSIFTLPGPDAAPKEVEVLQTGSNWVVMSWQDLKFCERAITSYLMRFDSSGGGNNTQRIRVPLDCTNRSSTGMTIFDSKICPELLILDACSVYSVVIEVEVFGSYRSQPSEKATLRTKPPEYLQTHIDEPVESGSDWLAFRWNLSVPQCQMATTGFQFNLISVRENSSKLYECNITSQNTPDSKFFFNTSLTGCDQRIIVPPCSDYHVAVIPKIFDTFYNEYRDNSTGRTTCETISAFVLSMKTGSDWISFNWTTSVKDCRDVLTGFWLSIAPSTFKSRKDDNLQFIPMKDCYCNLKNDEDIMFNTSFSCSNNWISPGIFPCSQYEIYLIPQFFDSLNGSANPSIITKTLPGYHITPVTQNIDAGKHWISFEWQASTETCRKDVTGLWITINSIPPNQTVTNGSLLYFCPTETNDVTFISFNTSSRCFHEQTLFPCNYYTFEIKLDINGPIGRTSLVNRTTTPGQDATVFINAQDSGTDWITFEWQSSVRECQKFITEYHLNITDVFNGVSQSKNLSRSCSTNPLVIGFNSSLPCAGLEISPCSNYLVSLVPQFHIGTSIISGIGAVIQIGSKSGNGGEIEQLIVASQGTNSLTLTWFEPTCRSTANLVYYNVTVIPNWNSTTHVSKTFLKIKPECLDKIPNGQVSMTLNESVCDRGYKFDSCAPYVIKILPVYQLPSANENIFGWETKTQTLPMQNEASVNNLTVQDVGTRWIIVSWPMPTCHLPISVWNLTELSLKSSVILPPDCPTYMNATHLTLNISDSILCRNGDHPINFEVPFIPCTNYTLGVHIKYPNLDVQPGSNNIVSATTEIELPGVVSNLTWSGTKNSVLLEWGVPKKNPQCVEGYQVLWNNKETLTKDTYASLNSLRPCTRILASVKALPNSISDLHESEIRVFVYTDVVDPAPVQSEVNVSILDNEWTRNVSWLKPEIDDCISGYKVSIKESTSTDVVYNETIWGKNSTWILFNDGFEKEHLYNVSIATFCDFIGETYVSDPTSHAFTWDTASGMIDTTSLVCGIIFPILALAIFYCAVLRRKSQNTILNPSLTVDQDKPTSVNQTPRAMNGRKRILVNELRRTIEWLETDSNYELSKEFELIKSMSSDKASCSVAKLPENQAKNRYCDILPYDHSRVRLNTVQGTTPHSDYINASFISGYVGKRVYIATQGPKPSTIEDFWLMCFKQDVKLIVALTSLEERGRVKCAQYWPSSKSCEYGNMYVELINEIRESCYTVRDFLITQIFNGELSAPKFARQMHYTKWPDFGCPENPEQLIHFIHAMRAESVSLYNTYRIACPIIVHCSAGVGRTGTLISLDILMEQARRKKIIDVFGTVLKLREDRDRMVQNEEQYHFLYKCIENYCRNELQLKDRWSLNSADYQSPDSIALTPLSFFKKDRGAAFSAV